MDVIQSEFEEKILKGSNLDYNRIIIPLCEKLENELGHDTKTWPIVYRQEQIVVYYELLYMRRDKLNDDLLILLMMYRPLIYYIRMLSLTYEEANIWRKNIKKRMPEIFDRTFAGERLSKFVEVMKLSKKKIDASPITYFHYFIGLKFSDKYIGLTKDELLELASGKNIIYININCKSKGDVYTYRKVTSKMGFRLLTLDVAKDFHPVIVSKLENYSTEMITGSVKDENYIVINYDDKHFTLISDGDELKVYDKEKAKRFIDGAIDVSISEDEYKSYAALMYHNSLTKIIYPASVDIKLPDAAKIYNEYIRGRIDSYLPMNANKYHQFVKEIESSITSDDMNENEKKLFIFYLDVYTFLEFNVYEFVSYLWGYFDPSLLL